MVGRDVPNLLIGYRGINILVKLKDGNKQPSQRKLTECEQAWHKQWRGQVAVVGSVSEALALVNAPPTPQKELITHEVL